jgi:thiamine-phosphate pyrophosphorylase
VTGSARIRGLYAIADTGVIGHARVIEAVGEAIVGGAAMIQYRDKTSDHARRSMEAHALSQLCRANEVVFIVNDDVALAVDTHADGVHLGRDDMDIAAARRALGAGRIIGVSCYNELQRALAAQQAGADYVAFGSFYPSPTKPAAVVATPTLLREAKAQLSIPVVAIGGITPENGARLIAAGADALAAITGVFAQPNIRAAAARYADLFETG